MSRLNELIAKLCPDGVEYKALGCLTTKPSTIRWSGETEPRRYIDLTSVDIETHCIGETAEVDAATAPSRARQLVATNDVLFATTRPTQMRYCMVPSDYAGEVCSTGFCVLRAKQDMVDSRYLYHSLGSFALQSFLEMRQTEGNYPAISDKDLKDYRIPVPPIEVQREIVRILDSFQELDDALTAEIEARKEILSACIDEMTVDAVPVENKADLIRMLERPITDGPHTTPQLVGEGIPFISAEAVSVGEGHIDFSHKRGFITRAFHEECCKKYKPKRNDVYMVKSGSTTGRVAMVETDEEFNIWSPLAAMRVNEANSARYLFYLLQSHDVQRQVGLHCSQGSQPNLGMRRLERFRVRIPTLSYQLNAVDSLDAIQTLIDSLRSEREARRKQFAYYCDKLLDFPKKVTT
jgi:type I restriction enzyme S subunit